jgi:hypothetical protein
VKAEARWCPAGSRPALDTLGASDPGLYLGAELPISNTAVPPTVLIAPPAHLSGLRAQNDLSDALAFADHEALRALEVITDQRPALIAIDHLFAVTSRGTAFIDRIKADPTLTSCEVRVVALDRGGAAVGPPVQSGASGPPAPLDQGTRRAPRFAIVDGVDVMIDGNNAALRDLSLVGAMVTSAAVLRPNQRIRLSLPHPQRPIRFNAVVAWARFELFKGAPRYRAGLEFVDADARAVQQFIDTFAVERFIEANRSA